jgi:membrane protein
MRDLGRTLVAAAKGFIEDKAPRLAASLSFYTIFSLPPLLVTLIGVAGFFLGAEEVRERLLAQLAGLVGQEPARMLGDAVRDAENAGSGLTMVLGTVMLLIGAGGAFGQLQDALNTMWNVAPDKGGGVMRFVQARFLSFAAVLGAGFLLLVSLAVSAVIAAVVDRFGQFDAIAPFLAALDMAASFLVITLVFALMFKFLPDNKVSWPDVWWGAAITSAMFVVGKFAIGFYLGTSDVGSAYGAAGSLIIVLTWIYYSSLIVLYGAEVTQKWSTRPRTPPLPERIAGTRAVVTEHSREPAGLMWVGLLLIAWLTRGRKANRSS